MRKHTLSISLIFFLLLPVTAFSEEGLSFTETQKSESAVNSTVYSNNLFIDSPNTPEEAGNQSKEKKRVKELIEKRTASSKHFLMNDGTYEVVFSSSDVHYKDAKGKWEEIDSVLVDEMHIDSIHTDSSAEVYRTIHNENSDKNGYRALKSPFDVKIPKDISKGYSIGKDYDRLTFIPINAKNSFGVVMPGSPDQIKYRNVWANTDLSLTLTSTGIKEDIILKGEGSPGKITFQVLGDLDKNFNSGSLTILPAFLVDKNGRTKPVKVTQREQGDKKFMDFSWDIKGLSYPITIDPTVTINTSMYSTYVRKSQPTMNFQAAAYSLPVEKSSNDIAETYIQFSLQNVPVNATISKAQINAFIENFNFSTSVTQVKLESRLIFGDTWISGTTWNTKPSLNYYEPAASSVWISKTNYDAGQRNINFDITNITKNSYNNSKIVSVGIVCAAAAHTSGSLMTDNIPGSLSLGKVYNPLQLIVQYTIPTIDTTPPTKPTNLSGKCTNTCSNVQLNWNPSTDNVGVSLYEIYQDGVYIDSTPANQNSYTVTNTTIGKTYTFSVLAKDAAGNKSEPYFQTILLRETVQYFYENGRLHHIIPQNGTPKYYIYDLNGNLIKIK
ncbi:DNRLRE domain-containing protein [Paenibacillus sp. FSL R5-0914]|uniref:DNRLRE domain-containing protein n=1 Tax=Paenibacillus sp. FSL R5-0914 TaxID=2921665 RepID=UPI0030F929DB